MERAVIFYVSCHVSSERLLVSVLPLCSRLAKSTLTLIPLLGIHAILFTFVIDESVPKGSVLRLIRLFCDLLFNSFQVRAPRPVKLVPWGRGVFAGCPAAITSSKRARKLEHLSIRFDCKQESRLWYLDLDRNWTTTGNGPMIRNSQSEGDSLWRLDTAGDKWNSMTSGKGTD